MFKKAIIHYPTDAKIMAQIDKDLAAFHCDTVVKYVESLNLNDRQIETLYASLADDIAAKTSANRIA